MLEGRPTDYSQDKAIAICERLVEGESLRSITRDASMPSIKTVYSWLVKFPEFLKQYEKAREDQIDTFADEMLDIADDGTNDYVTKENKDGSEFESVNSEHIQRSRLRVDTRKWIAERMKPKKYGPKSDLNLGGQKDNPIQIVNFGEINADPS